jgi:cob(I)alamin adenosyltransferase
MVGSLFYQERCADSSLFWLVEKLSEATALPSKNEARKAARRVGRDAVVAIDYGTADEWFILGGAE